jgi:hypothetical protein
VGVEHFLKIGEVLAETVGVGDEHAFVG